MRHLIRHLQIGDGIQLNFVAIIIIITAKTLSKAMVAVKHARNSIKSIAVKPKLIKPISNIT